MRIIRGCEAVEQKPVPTLRLIIIRDMCWVDRK